MKKYRIITKKGWIGYPGSTVQQNYAEDPVHGYLLWKISDRSSWDVTFKALPNPRPYITVPWQGTVEATLAVAKTHPKGARFRVYSSDVLSQKDASTLSSTLRQEMQATEVTYKSDQRVEHDLIKSGDSTIVKGDLRHPDVMMKLLKEYHRDLNVSDEDWSAVQDRVTEYLSACAIDDDGVRNITWSLRHLKFDNVLAYGDNNVINFENLNGITGIFGPNRAGKSSIVGVILYTMFNATDRGSIKNLHVVNVRKPYCYARAIINVNGTTDYVIERQTVKHESKKGLVHANTALNVFRMEGHEAIDLAGEERKDTEKAVRKLIGGVDDCLLTSFSAQDELKLFITHGSARRRQILSRFLDLDICDKVYDRAKNDFNLTKHVLKTLPDRDWDALEAEYSRQIHDCDAAIDVSNCEQHDVKERLDELKHRLAAHRDFTPVTFKQVESHRQRVIDVETQLQSASARLQRCKDDITDARSKLQTLDDNKSKYDIASLRRRLDAQRTLESTVMGLQHSYETDASVYKQQQRSLKILDGIPCEDKYPTCKFIKDANLVKEKIDNQRDKTVRALDKLKRAEQSLQVLREESLDDQIAKFEQIVELSSKMQVLISNLEVEQVKHETNLQSLVPALEAARTKLSELEDALKNDENAEVVALRSEIDRLSETHRSLDSNKLKQATERGRLQTLIDRNAHDRAQREKVLNQIRTFELISGGFSRRGIPHIITASQLPVINLEVSKILHGIVDFSVELEVDDDSDSMDVYINYGDSRRIIETCSGMEKMISSIAIRVALINISSLPKPDMFIIDEGFGSLDDLQVEACNRLLVSLKNYFRSIIVITHVDGIKDVADNIIEVTRNEKDARVVYN